MNILYQLSLAFLISLLSACSSLEVKSDYDTSVNFTHYKTFAFHQILDQSGSVSNLNKNRIIRAIKADLAKKGLTETKQNPDLIVNMTTIIENKKSVIAHTDYYGYDGFYRPYHWSGRYAGFAPPSTTTFDVREYKDGSLIIDIIDAANQQLIWQGIGNKEIDKPADNPDAVINEAVTKIMESFPPVTKK